MNMKRFASLALAVAAGAISATIFSGARARAGGAPSKNALVYTGRLTDAGGAPVTSQVILSLTLCADPDCSGVKQASTPQKLTPSSDGWFTLPLDDALLTSIGMASDLYVDIAVNGASIYGAGAARPHIAAAPYAIEATHANASDKANNASEAAHASTADNAISANSANVAANAQYAARTVFSANGAETITDGLFVGATSTQFSGMVGGYAEATQQCQDDFASNPYAHVCSQSELVRSASLNISIDSGLWYAGGTSSDCQGFNYGGGNDNGSCWIEYPWLCNCTDQRYIACCA